MEFIDNNYDDGMQFSDEMDTETVVSVHRIDEELANIDVSGLPYNSPTEVHEMTCITGDFSTMPDDILMPDRKQEEEGDEFLDLGEDADADPEGERPLSSSKDPITHRTLLRDLVFHDDPYKKYHVCRIDEMYVLFLVSFCSHVI